MDDNKNKKINEVLPDETQTDEELPDDALENVAGGGFKDWVVGLFDKPNGQSSGQ